MDALSEITGFSLVFLVATVFSGFQSSEKIEILGFEVRTRVATIVLFGILCGLIFNLTRLLLIISHLLSQLDGSQNRGQAIIILQTHSWVFNPFAQTSGTWSFLLDNLGLALLLLIWWLGFHTGYFLLKGTNLSLSTSVSSWILSLFYLVFGLNAMIIIMNLVKEINPETVWIKFCCLFLSIPIGAFGLRKVLDDLHRLSNEVIGNS